MRFCRKLVGHFSDSTTSRTSCDIAAPARGKFSAIKMKGIGSKLIKCIQMSFLVQVSIPISSDGPGWLERTEDTI